ncbi:MULTISPECIES: flagellar motor stator protein MotA [Asticcacaulis]|uniref:flagellar motor stator protein MotA n=1 Tax=Asticcacaulis TaxID=76890 RepID=UPI001AE0F302|nr:MULTISPECIES: flagellar motor stator protein MotA [Asticcacaulis]MBP2158571.1 chemotaxis protein MotA [Asticcacaulis solisilvae]MDR6799617.1 chemotaxis protein MotA [Asticcacaulis sp. BE141]
MFQIIGIVVLFAMVFGSYLLSGGSMAPILHSLPFEMMGIGGAAAGAALIANDLTTLKGMGAGMGKVFGGSKWKASDYRDLLSLLFLLTKTMKSKGVIALESHIEKPHDSTIFTRFPKIMKDHFAIDFICDTLRMMTMNLEDPHQVEDAMEKQLEKHHHEALHPAHAMQSMADAFPALGIVVAVMGVVKTMGSITEPPEILGGMIGGALVGTFLGVLLAYGLAGPFATRMSGVIEEEGAFYKIIQSVLVAHLHGNAAQISVEIGRGSIPSVSQPSFAEMEEALNNIPNEAA